MVDLLIFIQMGRRVPVRLPREYRSERLFLGCTLSLDTLRMILFRLSSDLVRRRVLGGGKGSREVLARVLAKVLARGGFCS